MASSIGTYAKKLFHNLPTYQSFQPFQHGQRALPAASKNSISQLRERNVDRANLRSEVRPPGKGFRAKSRKEVSPCMRRLFEDCLEQFSRPRQAQPEKLGPAQASQNRKMICYQKKWNAENKNLHVLIRQSKIKRKSIKNLKKAKIILNPYHNGICRLSSENILIFYTFSSYWQQHATFCKPSPRENLLCIQCTMQTTQALINKSKSSQA